MGAQTEVAFVMLNWMADQKQSGATPTAQVTKREPRGVWPIVQKGIFWDCQVFRRKTRGSGQSLVTMELPNRTRANKILQQRIPSPNAGLFRLDHLVQQ